ncbi:intercellular adhesion molecule 1-like isoform X2 [Heterodontus francisci]|uniref:intercellular adhesion molecule 1-like isoform X2 n=1 Tax=Heterodontus francisci TaxID=7792 RepID=UPI00355BA718
MGFRLTSRLGYICFYTCFFTVTEIMAGFDIQINANPLAVAFGDSLVVNCSTTCATETIIIEGIKHNLTHGTQWRAVSSSSIQSWSISVACYVKCSSESRLQRETITVYNRELNITSPPEVLEVNKTYSLECIGPRVYPNNKLKLTWLRGSEIVQRNFTGEEGFPDEDKRLRNIFQFTASMSDDGQEYTCLAEVDLGSNTTKPITNSSVTLQTYYKPIGTTISANKKIISESPVHFSNGDSIILICDSQGNPQPTLKWEYPKKSNVVIKPPGDLHISKATSKNNGIYKCTAANKLGADEKNVDITIKASVTGFEVWIDTNPSAVEFGDSLEVNCSTTCAEPIMTVEYKSGIHPNRRNGTNWSTDYFPSVQKWDFAAPCSVICKSDGRQLKEEKKVVTVYNRELNITSPPEVLEVNKTYSLECIGPRVYPNNKLKLTWLRGSEIVQRNFTGEEGFPDDDKRLRNIFQFTASMSGDGQEYTCLAEVDLGLNTTKPITNSSVTLQTYSFLDPPRILDKRPIEVKQEATLTCEVPNVYPAEKMRVRWFQDGKELNSVTTRPNSNTVRTTTTWKPQVAGLMEVVCTADFEEYPSVPPKNDSVFIEVFVFPDPEIQVPISPEGNPVNITCSVFNVSGELQLSLKNRNDILVNESSSTGLSIYYTVDAEAKLDGQQYICEAELKLQDPSTSRVKKQVDTLHVLYKPRNTTISVNNQTVSGVPVTLSEGDEVTIICNSNGNPTPTLKWEAPSNGRNIQDGPLGVLHISHATSEHQGIYKCTVTNKYGTDEKEVDIRIKDVTWNSFLVILFVTIGIIIALTITFGLYKKWTALRSGSYEVQNNLPVSNGTEHQ